MRKNATIGLILMLCLVAAGLAKDSPTIVESWRSPTPVPGKNNDFQKLIVIGITDDQELRHHFEDKFVSHLRTQKIDGVTSYSLVADLQAIEDRNELLDRIMEEGIDGAISIRLVPLKNADHGAWGESWAAEMEKDSSLRMLIEKTLPVEARAATRFGLEIAVWESMNWYRVWAGRTDGHRKEQLRKQSGDFVELTIGALNEGGLLR